MRLTPILLLLLLTACVSDPTGLAVLLAQGSYAESINLSSQGSSKITWYPDQSGKITSIKVSGYMEADSVGSATLSTIDTNYTIFETDSLSSLYNVTTPTFDTSTDIIGAGAKSIDDVFELTLNSNWDLDEDLQCTKWQLNNSAFCFGNSDCCSILGLESEGQVNDTFYVTFGRYNSSYENVISAQRVFANYSLGENPYSDIQYSNISKTNISFFDNRLGFDQVCLESCLLSINDSSYNIELETSQGSIHIENITYLVDTQASGIPTQTKIIPNLTIVENEPFILNLSEYFSDNDDLSFHVFELIPITTIVDDRATLVSSQAPALEQIYFIASDGSSNVSSNIVNIKIVDAPVAKEEVDIKEHIISFQPTINSPVRYIKKVNATANVANLTINISSDAINVTVTDTDNQVNISQDDIKVKEGDSEKNLTIFEAENRIKYLENVEERLEDEKDKVKGDKQKLTQVNSQLTQIQNEKNEVTGLVVAELRPAEKLFFYVASITGFVTAEVINESSELIIDDITSSLEIEYYLEGPYSQETELANGKQVEIISETSYENVISYVDLPESSSNARLYWDNESRDVTNDISHNVTRIDTNDNGLIDRIEWVTPHLSSQSYTIILSNDSDPTYPWSNGTFVNTTSDTQNVTLAGANISGTYESQIFEANSTVNWTDFFWIETYPYGEALPHNKTGELVKGGVNMTNNVLLLHLDNSSIESDGFFFDFSYTENNGTCVDCPTKTPGLFSDAMLFDGIDDLINVTDDMNLENTLAIEMWFKPASVIDETITTTLVNKENQYELAIKEGKLSFTQGSIELNSSAQQWTQQWYHVAAISDVTNLYLYINGIQVASKSAATTALGLTSTGSRVATFTTGGSLILSGTCSAGPCGIPESPVLVIKNSTSDVVGYINSSGGLCISDSNCNDYDIDCSDANDGSLVAKDSQDNIVAYMNTTGSLCLEGGLIQNGNP